MLPPATVPWIVALLLSPPQEAAPAPSIERLVTAAEQQVRSGDLPAARASAREAAQLALAIGKAPSAAERALLRRLGAAALEAADAGIARRVAEQLAAALAAMPDADPLEALRARSDVAAAVLAQADFAAARTMLERNVADFAARLPADDPELAAEQVRLSRVLRRLGDAPASLELGRGAEAALARVLEPDDRRLVTARINLGEALLDTGDLAGAAACVGPACEALAAQVPEESLELCIARGILGRIVARRGDGPGALALHEQALATLERAMPEDHIYRLLGMLSVAHSLVPTDPRRLVLTERALAGFLRTLGAEHFYTQNARFAVATAYGGLGRWAEARPYAAEAVRLLVRDHPRHRLTLSARRFAVDVAQHLDRRHEVVQERQALLAEFEARFPLAYPEVQAARAELAEARRGCGDLGGASALLEQALAIHTRDTPNDVSVLTRLLDQLAVVRFEQGDLPTALQLRERVTALYESTGAPLVQTQRARQDEATMRFEFDPERALELQQGVVDALAARADLGLESARAIRCLAAMKGNTGDHAGALAHLQSLVEVFHDRPATDPARLLDLGNLAEALARTGKEQQASEAWAEVIDGWSQCVNGTLEAALARSNRAACLARLGQSEAAAELAKAAIAAVRAAGLTADLAFPDCLQRATRIAIAARDRERALAWAREWAAEVRQRLHAWRLAPRELALWSNRNEGVLGNLAALAAGTCGLAADPTLAAEFLLTVEAMRSVDLRTARESRRSLAGDLRAEVERLEDAVSAAAAEVAAAARTGGPLRDAVEARDRAQRELAAVARRVLGYDPLQLSPRDFVRALPATAAVAVLRTYVPVAADGTGNGPAELVAIVVPRDGDPVLLPLGACRPYESMVEDLARLGTYAEGRGSLRKLVLDPIRARLPAGVTDLYLAVEGSLQLVPWDALELQDGRLVGDVLRIRQITTLFELLEDRPVATAADPQLLACGGIDYGTVAAGAGPRAADASSPRAGAFAMLPASKAEVAAIGDLFAALAPKAGVIALSGAEAGKARLLGAAAGASHLHLATHGYFANQLGKALGQPASDRGAAPSATALLAPQVLCGLALAGANAAADAAGRHPGIVTAEELASLDLSRCELVVLSSCEGSAGLAVRGCGMASLRTAFCGAGARCVVASSWRIDDEATRALMIDFYERLLREPADRRDPHVAMWQARLAAKARGADFADWAGWVVAGR